ENTAKAGIQALRNFLKSIGMPLTFEELGAKEEDIPALAHMACWGDGRNGIMGGFVDLTEEDVAAIYRLML
ncbi:MAG: iron-containing alcohol dehydrogenase, partial [Lachnospiraceae bacterium]|nr:iron-containing alcohol dehydrogenase [Lachnospiraceae bacterium]